MSRLYCIMLVLVVLLVPSCGREQSGAVPVQESPLTIWWAQWAPADGLQALSEGFTAETGIPVVVHQIPWANYQDQVFLEFGNRETKFDIVVGDSQWIGRGATKGLYVDLTDWLSGAVDMDTIHPRARTYLCEYPTGSGRYFAAPCETDAVGFAYRKDWFEDPAEQAAFREKYGRDLAVPGTWQEFTETAVFFTRPDQKRYGCAILTGRGYDSLTMGFQQVMWAFGGGWGDPATYTASGYVNGDAAVAALEFYKSLLKYAPAGAENYDYGKTMEAFTNGSTAMVMDYFAFYPSITDEMGDRAGYFAMPAKDGKRSVSLGGQGLSISAKIPSGRQDMAKQFIAWFLKTDVQKEWIRKPAGFTANTAILASEEFRNATPFNGPFADSLDAMQDFWNVPQYNELLAEAQKFVGEALDGKRSCKEALDALAIAHDRIFQEAGFQK